MLPRLELQHEKFCCSAVGAICCACVAEHPTLHPTSATINRPATPSGFCYKFTVFESFLSLHCAIRFMSTYFDDLPTVKNQPGALLAAFSTLLNFLD